MHLKNIVYKMVFMRYIRSMIATRKKPTVHNPTNFRPEDYEIVDYIDNQPPRYMGGPVKYFAEERKAWRAHIQQLFPGWPGNGQPSLHRCCHCGCTNVRYICIAEHRPTEKNVVFGDICCAKIGFESYEALKAEQVRAKAELQNSQMKAWLDYKRFVKAHPEIRELVRRTEEDEVHANNHTAKYLVGVLKRYGSLYESSIQRLKETLDRDVEFTTRRQTRELQLQTAPPAPEGRVEVEGKILSLKEVEGSFGTTTKMLVELANGNRVYASALTGSEIGQNVKFKATFKRADRDAHFAFGKFPKAV